MEERQRWLPRWSRIRLLHTENALGSSSSGHRLSKVKWNQRDCLSLGLSVRDGVSAEYDASVDRVAGDKGVKGSASYSNQIKRQEQEQAGLAELADCNRSDRSFTTWRPKEARSLTQRAALGPPVTILLHLVPPAVDTGHLLHP